MHSGALLDSEQAEYAVNWSPRVDLFQVSGPRGGGVVRPPRPPLATGLPLGSGGPQGNFDILYLQEALW